MRGSARHFHLGANEKDGGILHARFVVDRLKCDSFIEKHDRDQVFHADVGDVAVANSVGFVGGDANHNFLNVVGGNDRCLKKSPGRQEELGSASPRSTS